MITRGELQNLEAIVHDMSDTGKVLVMPFIDGFNEAVDFDPDELRKVFKVRRRVWDPDVGP